ncbi:MAG: acyltransferase [Bacteroidales bacterium]|jgi:hypothetical protein|nr:acyltransferase [Bacteroidales bacterium]
MSINYNKYKKIIFEQNFDFERLSLIVFEYQFYNNKTYQNFCDLLHKNPENVKKTTEIPFFPVDFFKNQKIISNNEKEKIVFSSSSTTSIIPSKHYVTDIEIYENSFISTFKKFYGNPTDYCILGLLPSYIERGDSSLIYMVQKLIKLSSNKDSGFYLNEYENLFQLLKKLEEKSQKYILFGVSYALLNFCEYCNISLKNSIIIETGGMKGKRKEITKSELHKILKTNFGVEQIHSEYGMTELLSQAYSQENEIFHCPPYMKIFVGDIHDPLAVKSQGIGSINIIDLANINSCCFIATSDIGEVFTDGSFKILGRMDNSEIRGCNLMVSML